MYVIVEHRPRHRLGIVDRTQRLQQLLVSAIVEEEVAGIGDDNCLRLDNAEVFVLAEARQALRRKRAPNEPRPLMAIDLVDRMREITIAHDCNRHIGCAGVLRHRDIEVLNVLADVIDNRGELIAAVGPGAVVHVNPHRHLELANSIHRPGDMQFCAEGRAEKSLADLSVGKGLPLGSATAADLLMLARCRCRQRGGQHDGRDRGDSHAR